MRRVKKIQEPTTNRDYSQELESMYEIICKNNKTDEPLDKDAVINAVIPISINWYKMEIKKLKDKNQDCSIYEERLKQLKGYLIENHKSIP